ncbi:MAG: sigma-70 family RNA polymerase sigma factor, partial [Bacteroidota bacterium]
FLLHHSKWRRPLRKWVRNGGGSNEDFDDVLIETITAFDLNLKRDLFEEKANLQTYFLGIGKRVWLKKLNQRIKEKEGMTAYIPIADALRAEELDQESWRPRYERVASILKKLSERDREMLMLKVWGWSHSEIAPKVGLNNEQTAKATLYRIKQFIRKAVKFLPYLLPIIK